MLLYTISETSLIRCLKLPDKLEFIDITPSEKVYYVSKHI